jgi:hypothetical protein
LKGDEWSYPLEIMKSLDKFVGACVSILFLVDLALEFLNAWKIIIKAIANSVNSMTNFLEKSVTTGLSNLA